MLFKGGFVGGWQNDIHLQGRQFPKDINRTDTAGSGNIIASNNNLDSSIRL